MWCTFQNWSFNGVMVRAFPFSLPTGHPFRVSEDAQPPLRRSSSLSFPPAASLALCLLVFACATHPSHPCVSVVYFCAFRLCARFVVPLHHGIHQGARRRCATCLRND
eukprot:RCo046456